MHVEVPVSLGELLDKISILKIKLANAKSATQLKNITYELEELERRVPKEVPYKEFIEPLMIINSTIWYIEDRIRRYEKLGLFGEEFIETARQIYIYNDKRADIKRNINLKMNSSIVEEKIY